MKTCISIVLAAVAAFSFVSSADAASVGLNFAGASNNPGGRKALAAGTSAGAPTFAQTNWNNTPNINDQVGTPSSANDTILNLNNNLGVATTLDITFTSAQTWGENFGGSPTGDQMINGNGITDGTPTVIVSQIPYAKYDVVVYDGMYSPGRNSTYTMFDGVTTTSRFAFAPTWLDFNTTGYVEITSAAVSAGTRQTGNYTVFRNLTASSFTVTSVGGGGINAIQIVAVEAPAPEPSSAVAMVLGCLGLGWMRRRKLARA